MKLYSNLYLAFCISSRFGGRGGARWEKLSREDLGPVVRKLGAEQRQIDFSDKVRNDQSERERGNNRRNGSRTNGSRSQKLCRLDSRARISVCYHGMECS